MEKPALISKDSLLPLGLVFTLLGAAMSFGVMYQKVESVRADIVDVKTQLTRLDTKIDAVLLKGSVATNEVWTGERATSSATLVSSAGSSSALASGGSPSFSFTPR